jgi:Amt family ammonium transporter
MAAGVPRPTGGPPFRNRARRDFPRSSLPWLLRPLLALLAMIAGPTLAHDAEAPAPAADAANGSAGGSWAGTDDAGQPLLLSAGDWLAAYAALAAAAPRSCPPPDLPELDAATPAQTFVLADAVRRAGPGPLVAYSGDPIAERFIVLAQDVKGCVHIGASGRLLPFDARSLPSPFPNVELPAALGLVPPVAIISDGKSLRPWINVRGEDDFRRLSNRTWLLLGLFMGMLPILLVVGIVVLVYRRNALALAYVAYIAALIVYQIQALGIGFAWLPFWPPPELGRPLHSFGVGLVTAGIGTVVVAFLRPRGLLRVVLIGGIALTCLAFFSSWLTMSAHRFAAGMLCALALVVLAALLHRLQHPEPALRWFAAGLGATMAGGGLQAASIIGNGAGLPAIAAFAFPIGNSIEAVFWLMALMSRLHAENQELHRQLIHDANHDPLTGSYGRRWLRGRLAALLAWTKAGPDRRFSLLFIDLDGFKQINDRLGHAAGDGVLRAVANAIIELSGDGDNVGRFGGDEFVVLMRPGADDCLAEGAAAAIVARFQRPVDAGGVQVRVSASVGILTITTDYADVDQIIRDADVALYVAKHKGGGRFVRFERQMRDDAERRSRMRQDLEAAVERNELLLHYQPIFDLHTMMPVGFEALVRWRRPGHGLVAAADFLPAAAEAGLLREIGARVIDLAFAQVSRWQKEGLWRHGQHLSLNVWGQQLADDSLPEQIEEAFGRYPVDPSSIRIEIAEHAVRAEADLARRIVPRLQGSSIMVGLDDFGSGLSSLTLIAELKLDLVKIDRGIVDGVVHLAQSQDLARAACALAVELGCLTVAVGIETREQLNLLQTLGVDHGQGLFFAAPMPAAEVPPWIEMHHRQQPGAARHPSHKQLH